MMIKNVAVGMLVCGAMLSADTLILRNGSSVEGAFVGGDNRSVRFLVNDRVNVYRLDQIDTINFGPAPESSDATSPPAYAPPPQAPPAATQAPAGDDSNPYSSSNNAPPPAPPSAARSDSAGRGMQIPAGAPIIVRLIDPVNSDTDRLGQTYRASIDEPVVVDGYEIIPRGADTVVSLIAAQQSGRIEGRTTMTLALRSVTVNGRTYGVTTTGVVQVGASRTKRSAEVIGGTAALGAVIGAIAGGGTGAAVGAVAGGAAGTAAQVYTAGDKVKVPSETRLTFTLQNPVYL